VIAALKKRPSGLFFCIKKTVTAFLGGNGNGKKAAL
jgi:hypothetical protein